MKRIYLILILIVTIVFLVGCMEKRHITPQICTTLKHSTNNTNGSIYMENSVCIIEGDNYTYSHVFVCDHWKFDLFVIIKNNEDSMEIDEALASDKTLSKFCDVSTNKIK